MIAPRSKAFVEAIKHFAIDHAVPLIDFGKGQRKDDVLHEYLARSDGSEQVLFIGRAQEKMTIFRTERRRNPTTGVAYPWIVPATAMVNQFYVYAVDDDFGPFFLKFGSYFPYTGRVCLNGHEYAKRQAAKAGIGFTALDNGFAALDDPADVVAVQAICDGLTARGHRRAGPQVAGPAAAPVHPGGPGRRVPLSAVGAAGRVLPDPGAGQARSPGGSSSSRPSGTTSTSADRTGSR